MIFGLGSHFEMASIMIQTHSIRTCRAVGIALFLIAGTAETRPLPSHPDSLFSGLKGSHPRLILGEERLKAIQSQITPGSDFEQVLKFMRKKADSLLTTPPCSYELVDSSILEVSRTIQERLILLSFLANQDGDKRYADRALKELESASRFPDWNPRKFLDVAEMATAFAFGYDWLYAFASEPQRTSIRQAIVAKAFVPAQAEFQKPNWWVNSNSNWNPVCNGGLALAALALGRDEPTAVNVLHRSLRSLQVSGALQAYSPDGAYSEGIGYWSYSSRFLAMLFGSLQTALGEDFGMSRETGLPESGMFPIYCEGPSGRMFNYGDSKDAKLYPFWMSGFALQYQQPLYGWFAQKHTGLHVFDLLWYEKYPEKLGPASLPLAKRFRGPELAIFRSAWTDTNATFLAFKAGNPESEHSHLDAGSFVLDALGKRWAVDLGSDRYSLPGYFMDYFDSATRFTYYRIRAEGNNTLTINPGKGPDQSLTPTSSLIAFDPGRNQAVGDLTSAYSGQAVKVMRGVSLQSAGRVLIQDEFELRAPGEVWWRMHTEATISVAQGGRSAVLTQGSKRLWVALLGQADGNVLTSMKAEPLPGSPRPAGQDANAGVSVLAVHLARTRQARIAVWMAPLREGEAIPTGLPAVEALDSPFWRASQSVLPAGIAPGEIRLGWESRRLRVTLADQGGFALRLFNTKGHLLAERRGRGPGEYYLTPLNVQSPMILGTEVGNRRNSLLVSPP